MAGKLVGGNRFKAAISDLSRKLAKAGTLRVGFLEGAKYPNGTPVAMIAAIQNYGAPRRGIPPRPFFSNMVKDKSDSWGPAMAETLKRTNYNTEQTLELTGQGIKGQLQQSIIDTYSPALSPITVMLRGMKANDSSLVVTGKTVGEAAQRVADGKTNYGASTKPLVDSGYLLSRVDYEVNLK